MTGKTLLLSVFIILITSCSFDGGNYNTDERKSFYHVDQIERKLKELEESNPSISMLELIDYSGESRKITALKISDNVSSDESEPVVRLLGNIHGDEKLGGELLIKLAEHLTTNYRKDDQIKKLVDNLEIWIEIPENL